ncbi:hypothetical protein JCM9279_004666 [Rhodotorula babjevae]
MSLPSPAPTPRASPPLPTSSSSSSAAAALPVLWLPTPIHPTARKLAAQLFDVIDHEDLPRAATWTDEAVAVVVRQGGVSADEARRAAKLRIIARNGVGTETVPLEACREKGIAVTNQPGSNAKAVAEQALVLAISVARRTVEFDRRLRRGERMPSIHWLAETLEGKTLGLVGMGDIAREFAKKAVGAFDMKVLVYSPTSSPTKWTSADASSEHPPIPHRRVSSLDELLSESDVVSLHCPLNDQTQQLMSAPQFARMKPSAIFLNTGRGGLVDEPALIDALERNEIYGAGLDVLAHEPATLERYERLFKLENVVVSPHAGAGTHQVQIESCVVAVETCASYLRGEGIGKSKKVV